VIRTAIIAVLLIACVDTGVGTTTIPGREVASSFHSGDRLGLIGVEKDSPLSLAPIPGETVGGLELVATEDRLVATGVARQVGEIAWEQMQVAGQKGYLPRPKLAFLGDPEDVTHLYSMVSDDTVRDLGYEIAAEIEATRIVLVAEPGPSEVVYDVVGLEDDAVAGYRIRVVARVAGDELLSPALVERTPMCTRGTSDEGLCL
jgi:hypothetical protein